jgi:hypothetical protein
MQLSQARSPRALPPEDDEGSGLAHSCYIVKNGLQDLSIGKPGEAFDAEFAADMVEIEKIK